MKKTLLFLAFLSSIFGFSQTFSTGTQVLKDDLSVNLEIDDTTTTLTLTGASDVWFAVGFGGSNMFSGADVFRTNGTTIVDAYTVDQELPPTDSSQDWTLVSNTVNNNVRTIVATRANNTGDFNDYVFSNSAGSINIIWAMGTSTTYLQHTGGNRGATTLGVTLSTKDVELFDFIVAPNPTTDNLEIQLPSDIENAIVNVSELSGRTIKNAAVSTTNNTINLADVASGMYLLKVQADDKLGIKRIIKK